MPDTPITLARPRRGPPILLCRKCLSGVPDAKALRKALKSELKQRSAAHGIKRGRLVLTGCLGICPKRAVVAASAATLSRGEYVLLKGAEDSAAAADVLIADNASA